MFWFYIPDSINYNKKVRHSNLADVKDGTSESKSEKKDRALESIVYM